MARKLFCEYGPIFYQISLCKEISLRHLRDFRHHIPMAKQRSTPSFPHLVKGHRSTLLRKLEGVDMSLQQGKVVNLRLAAAKLDWVTIAPGETFSFWRLVGRCTRRKGYQDGMVLSSGNPIQGVGGGMCQMANLIHWMVLQSPLTVTELHHHTDALFPDQDRRVPFGTGTSIFYNNVDYRFRNDTPYTFQLRIWLEQESLCGELRTDSPLPYRYRIEERDHHYAMEADGYYRNSEIWKRIIDRDTTETVQEILVFKNHSKVLFDYAFIPVEQIRTPETDEVVQ